MPSPDLIHHYTNVDAFLEIVETNSFWASDLSAVNDPGELSHVRTLLEELSLQRSLSLGSAEMRKLDPDAEYLYPCDPPRNVAESLLEQYRMFAGAMYEFLRNEYSPPQWRLLLGRVFGVSFCKESDLLSQWRAYGLSGEGLCIGLEKQACADAFASKAAVLDVEYGMAHQVRFAQDLIVKAFNTFHQR